MQTFDTGGTMFDGGSLATTVLNMLADVSQCCPIIKDLVIDVLVGHVFKGLPYLHLTLWLLRDVCCVDGDSLP